MSEIFQNPTKLYTPSPLNIFVANGTFLTNNLELISDNLKKIQNNFTPLAHYILN